MNNIQSRWFLGLGGTLLVALAGCDVSVGKCDRDDAGECVNLFPDDDEDGGRGKSDAGRDGSVADAGVDGAAGDAGDVDAGGADGGGTDGSIVGAPISLEDFCREVNAIGFGWAQQIETCCDQNGKASEATSDTAASILSLFRSYSDQSTDGCINFYQGLIDTNKLTFHGEYAAACAQQAKATFPVAPTTCPTAGFKLEALDSMVGHGAQTLSQIPACEQALQGAIALGKECSRDEECGQSLACKPASGSGAGATSTCQTPGGPSAPCEDRNDCAFGFVCSGSASVGGKQCLAVDDLVDQGSCSGSGQCIEGKICAGGTCSLPDASESGICSQ